MTSEAKAKISLRKAGFQDIEFLWYLRCQPEVFKYFRTPEIAPWEDHLNWIMPVLLGFTNKELFVIEYSEKPVGQLRFDYEEESAEISISLLKEFWGKGIGTQALRLAVKWAKKSKKAKQLLAELHQDNVASQKLFEKSGLKLQSQEGVWKKYILK